MREVVLTMDQTIFYMAELSIAIDVIQKLGFVYRDIKPDKIYILRNQGI